MHSLRFPACCGSRDPATVEAVDGAGETSDSQHGRHLHLTVRPTAPVQLLFTGHMDTVFGEDHAFQQTRWLEDGVLNGPGVADMKGGIAVMLAALKAIEAQRDRRAHRIRSRHQQRRGSRFASLRRRCSRKPRRASARR